MCENHINKTNHQKSLLKCFCVYPEHSTKSKYDLLLVRPFIFKQKLLRYIPPLHEWLSKVLYLNEKRILFRYKHYIFRKVIARIYTIVNCFF